MRMLLSAGALALAVILSAQSASAQTISMVATLTGGDENPPVLTGAVGTAELDIDPLAREIAVTVRVFNLPTGSTAGHIHAGPRGINGPVVVDFPIPTGRTGDFSLTFRVGPNSMRPNATVGVVTFDDVIQTITGGGGYVNIHSTTNPGGEIRGQLMLRPGS
jgi:CHRD domain